jgi:prepilin-type N-terminal cleavage/methylation domain-containing protein
MSIATRRALLLIAACAALAYPRLVYAADLDHTPPAIFVVAPQPVAQDLPLELRVRVEDPNGVAAVHAFVKGENDRDFEKLVMERDATGEWVASVPAGPRRGLRISYFVEATDAVGNGPGRSGSPARPYLARTIVEQAPASAPVVSGGARGRGLWLIAAMVAALAGVWFVSRARRQRVEREFWREVLDPVLRLPPAQRAPGFEQLLGRAYRHPLRGHIHLDREEILRWMQEIKLAAPPTRRASRAVPVAAAPDAAEESGALRDASGNRRARFAPSAQPQENTAPASAGAKRPETTLRRRESIAETLRELEEDIFWVRVLEPIRSMPEERIDEAIRALAARPLTHPHEGGRLYHPNVLHAHLDRVRDADVDGLERRMHSLGLELAALGIEKPHGRSAGMTLVESLVVIAILGTGLAIGSAYLRPMEHPVERGAERLESLFRGARSRAVSTLSAYRIRPETNGSLLGEYSASCNAVTWTAEPALELALPDLVTLTDTSWSVCFDTRGIASSGLLVTVDHPDFYPRVVEVMLGGAVRRVP